MKWFAIKKNKKIKKKLGLQKPRPAQKRQILKEQGTRPTKADRHTHAQTPSSVHEPLQ